MARSGRGRGGRINKVNPSLAVSSNMAARPNVNITQPTPTQTRTQTFTHTHATDGSGAANSNDSNDLCGTCNTAVDPNTIGCDMCPKWFHPSPMCLGIPEPLILTIQQYGGNAVKFVCTECRTKDNNNDGGGVTEAAFQQLFLTVKTLCEAVQALTAQVSSLNTQARAPSSTTASSVSASDNDQMRLLIREENREMEERKKRKSSIIIRGVQAETTALLKPSFDQVCTHLVGSTLPVTDVVCISSEKRLFRAKIQDDERRQALLDSARRLRDSPFPNVFINRDLTYKQRQELRARRIQRNEQSATSSLHPPRTSGSSDQDETLSSPIISVPTTAIQAGNLNS